MNATGSRNGLTLLCCAAVSAFALMPEAPARAEVMPRIEAGSLGGNVRGKPGLDAKKLTKLEPGEKVILLESSGTELNGYPWFKIEFRDGETGHVWGGILCARKVAVDGVREQCPGYEITTGTVTKTKIPVPTKTRMVHYECADGTHLVVRYETRGEEKSAVYSHDGYPEVNLAAVSSDRGEAYTDGENILRAVGRKAELRGKEQQRTCSEP